MIIGLIVLLIVLIIYIDKNNKAFGDWPSWEMDIGDETGVFDKTCNTTYSNHVLFF